MSRNKGHYYLMRSGQTLLVIAAFEFVVAMLLCIVIQGVLLNSLPNIVVAIAYFSGPLPIVPVLIALVGLILMGASILL